MPTVDRRRADLERLRGLDPIFPRVLGHGAYRDAVVRSDLEGGEELQRPPSHSASAARALSTVC